MWKKVEPNPEEMEKQKLTMLKCSFRFSLMMATLFTLGADS